MYLEEDLVGIAKRENNKKRKYLVVNKLQGKHISVKPSKAIDMFDSLADLLLENYKEEKLLLIGFAETATAIGASVAIKTGCQYMQTTREKVDGVQYLYFSENHSHATEQKLVKDDIDMIINDITRIVFVEDEVTTGNTIINIMNIIKSTYGDQKIKYSIASILNGMDSDALELFKTNDIGLHYLVKTEHSKYEDIAMKYLDNGKYYDYSDRKNNLLYNEYEFYGHINARRITASSDYLDSCKGLWTNIKKNCMNSDFKKILVLGTEEFMYPALFIADQLEKLNNSVSFHATTRSPIIVSDEANYPLHTRYELRSMYETERIIYVYDLGQYDQCYIITDAARNDDNRAEQSLIKAINLAGTFNINLIRWC